MCIRDRTNAPQNTQTANDEFIGPIRPEGDAGGKNNYFRGGGGTGGGTQIEPNLSLIHI